MSGEHCMGDINSGVSGKGMGHKEEYQWLDVRGEDA